MENKDIRVKSLARAVWRLVMDYCHQSSLHGLKYVSNPDLPYIERYMWLAVFIICVGVAAHLIYDVWDIWMEKPFLITFDSHMTPIWTIPFPAVTICTHFAVKRSIVDLATTNNK
ncbi:hypothetical protein J6590_052175 [Homalodisca vitripennis]|nr:hypothetical protein J6590_052175 [Homalodisca vitripennis]